MGSDSKGVVFSLDFRGHIEVILNSILSRFHQLKQRAKYNTDETKKQPNHQWWRRNKRVEQIAISRERNHVCWEEQNTESFKPPTAILICILLKNVFPSCNIGY